MRCAIVRWVDVSAISSTAPRPPGCRAAEERPFPAAARTSAANDPASRTGAGRRPRARHRAPRERRATVSHGAPTGGRRGGARLGQPRPAAASGRRGEPAPAPARGLGGAAGGVCAAAGAAPSTRRARSPRRARRSRLRRRRSRRAHRRALPRRRSSPCRSPPRRAARPCATASPGCLSHCEDRRLLHRVGEPRHPDLDHGGRRVGAHAQPWAVVARVRRAADDDAGCGVKGD